MQPPTIQQVLDEQIIDVCLAIEEVARPHVETYRRLARLRQRVTGRPAPPLVVTLEP
ncbi:MAG: hypothetical protein ACRDJE_04725 [Dehalococcoidia bacterium]